MYQIYNHYGSLVEISEHKMLVKGVKLVAAVLVLKQLLTSEGVFFVYETGSLPPCEAFPELDLNIEFKEGITLDMINDPFEFLSMRRITGDPTLWN